MLPFMNLTSSDFIASAAPGRPGSLVPEGSDALQGAFANVLTAAVGPAALLPTVAGEELPETGNPLPAGAPGTASRHDTDIDVAMGYVDLAYLGDGDAAEPLPDGAPATIVLDVATAAEYGDGSDVGPSSTIYVPPDPAVADAAVAELSAAAGPTGEAPTGAADVPVVGPLLAAVEADRMHQGRDRVADITSLRDRPATPHATPPAVGPSLPFAATGAPVTEARPGTEPLDIASQLPERQRPGADTSARTAVAAEPAVMRVAPSLVTTDDAGTLPRSLQPAAWHPGGVMPDVSPEPGARHVTEMSVVAPRTAASPHSAVLSPAATAAQTLEIPVQQPGWDSALADRVTMMANGRLQNAELRLSPSELGPLRIQLDIDDGVANVSFQSHHPLTRDALEQAMPRLRELLAENGLTLGQADVRDESGELANREAAPDARASSTSAGDDVDVDAADATLRSNRVPEGLVDTFA